MNTRLTIQSTGITDVGKQRTGNEDTYYCDTVGDDRNVLALVVDGCGGYKGGAVAAAITRDAMLEYMNAATSQDKDGMLKSALVYANNKVYDRRNEDESLRQMCCVATAVWVDLDRGSMTMVHVGDSRIYASIKGRIIKLSHDHSPIGRYEEEGVLSETEAMQHPSRNVIERAIGIDCLEEDTTYIEEQVFPITAGISLLLCTDGLSDLVTSAEMDSILSGEDDLQCKAEKLVEAANGAGGKDNITLVILHIDGEGHEQAQTIMNRYSTILNPNRMPDYQSLLQNVTMKSISSTMDKPLDDLSDMESTKETGFVESDESVSEETSTCEPQVPLEESIEKPSVSEENLSEYEDSPSDNKKQDETVEHVSEPLNTVAAAHPYKPNPWKKYIRLALIWLCLTAGAVYGVVTYHTYKERVIQERNEIIRQRVLHRNLYYNINNLSRDTTTVIVPDSQINVEH